MPRLRLKVRRCLYLAKVLHEMCAARVKSAARWRTDQAGRLAWRYVAKDVGIFGVRVGDGGQQCTCIGM